MRLPDLPFSVTDWPNVEPVAHPGDTGVAIWRTRQLGDIRVRLIEYSAGYAADHWCAKGHVLFCVSGELVTHLEDGTAHVLRAGMSYDVGEGHRHRSSTPSGAVLFVVD